jgi:competence protein ComEC
MKMRLKIWTLLFTILLVLSACSATDIISQSGIDATTKPAASTGIDPTANSTAVTGGTQNGEVTYKSNTPESQSEPFDDIEEFPVKLGSVSIEETIQAPVSSPTNNSSYDINDSELTIYFIDVGQADSTLVICDGMTMLIDGGNAADSNLIYTFLQKHDVKHLDYVIATHAHEDHVGGLAGALNFATVGVAYSPVTEYDSRAFENFDRYLGNHGVSITVPKPGDKFSLGAATVEILAPVKQYDEPNNTSIVLMITHGEAKFLFTGDAERDAEQDILEKGYDLSATVYHVGHHGSNTSTSYPFLREIMPQYAVISCGRNNSYGHPDENLLSRLRDADVTLFRTDMQGDITCVSDGKTVSFTTERNANAQTNPTVSPETTAPTDKTTQNSSTQTNLTASSSTTTTTATEKTTSEQTADDYNEYIGNKNTKKFHEPSCRTLPAEKNRVYFDTRKAAISKGYVPCKNCNP